jgi:hypothetical protein
MPKKILAATKYVPRIIPIQEYLARLLPCKLRGAEQHAAKWLPHVLRFCGALSPIYSPILFRELDLIEYVPDVLLELLANRGAPRVRGPCRLDQCCGPPDDFGAPQRSRRHRSTPQPGDIAGRSAGGDRPRLQRRALFLGKCLALVHPDDTAKAAADMVEDPLGDREGNAEPLLSAGHRTAKVVEASARDVVESPLQTGCWRRHRQVRSDPPSLRTRLSSPAPVRNEQGHARSSATEPCAASSPKTGFRGSLPLQFAWRLAIHLRDQSYRSRAEAPRDESVCSTQARWSRDRTALHLCKATSGWPHAFLES